jgi:hypothetical protein
LPSPRLQQGLCPDDPSAAVAGTLGVITHPDGGRQVTYDGLPLYVYAKDAKAGDTNGQGVGNIWFVVKPTDTSGMAAQPAPPAAKPGSSSSSGW